MTAHRSFPASLTLVLAFALLAPSLAAAAREAQPPDDAYARLKQEAEKHHAEKSFSRALALYQQAEKMTLPEPERRWVTFRIGDSMWRNRAASRSNDDTDYQRAVQILNDLLRVAYPTSVSRDHTWAAIQESLGDYWWIRNDSRNWHPGWQHYAAALDYWAGQRDLDLARARYLDIVFRASEPAWFNEYIWYRQNTYIPSNILDNAVKIAATDEDRSHAQYLLAMSLRHQGGVRLQNRVEELFQSVLTAGRTVEWYDDALFFYAEWLSQQGRPARLDDGQWTTRVDYRGAVELYRRLIAEFPAGRSAYVEQARNRIREITEPQLALTASNAFLPSSEQQFQLGWRNIRAIDISIHKMDLTKDVAFPARSDNQRAWLDTIDLSKAPQARSFVKDTKDAGDHLPGGESITLDEKLEPGAYVIEARAGDRKVRDLLLISDVTLITKTVADRTVVFACDAVDGSPVADAVVSVWEVRRSDNRFWTARRHEGRTDASGIAAFALSTPTGYGGLFFAARKDDRQAFNNSWANQQPSPGRAYRIYAFTDRPAYRPGEKVEWKAIARLYRESTYQTPANQVVAFEINDPQGAKVKEGSLTLNNFGAAWDSLEVTTSMPLGQYTVQFWTKDRGEWIGNAALFRLEEYKLPEYEVTVSTPRVNGKRLIYQVGDTVEAQISAQYYFGAPVANAEVEVVIYQRPYWHSWQPPRDFGWFHDDQGGRPWRNWYGRGNEIRREKIKTDDAGLASISFDTPLHDGQNYEYEVEARVVDSSRREVVGTDVIRVTMQKYFVYPRSEHNLYKPGENVKIEFTALDANNTPVEATGAVEVYRDEWREIWITPDGREVTGAELAAEQARHRYFPPLPEPGRIGWRLKHRGYTSEKILSQQVKTNAEGKGELTFKPEKDGYYRITWQSETRDVYPVGAQTWVWVCADASRAIGYYHGGVDIIVDKDTFKAGQVAPVMISVPTSNRYVLFTVEGNTLHDHRVVHVEGTVKLIHVEVTDQHIPNVWLNASMVQNGQVHTDSEQVIVPPVEHFLNVDVALDQSAYKPGSKGTLKVTTKDHNGKPVSADVSVALVDESVFYIQSELAGDIRQFFYRDRQGQAVATSTSFNEKSYVRLKKNEKGEIVVAGMDPEHEGMVVSEGLEEMADADGAVTFAARRRSGAAPPASAAMPGGGGGGLGGGAREARDAAGMEMAQGNMPMEALGRMNRDDKAGAPMDAGTEGGDPEAAVRVRSDFRSTALWVPSVVTDANGVATVDVSFPDTTSRWKATARAASSGADFGFGSASVQTRQPLIVRLQAPRFFVVGDELTISAVINNNTDAVVTARFDQAIAGLEVLETRLGGKALDAAAPRQVEIPANGSSRVDYLVAVRSAGEARLTVTARAGAESDGMEKTYPVFEHGIEKHLVNSGKVRGDDVTLAINLPPRKDGSTTLSVQVTPSMAVTMLDALPYLIDYPYGCVEQTMSRFVPAAIVARTLKDLNVDPAVAMSRLFGGIEQQHAAATHPGGKRDLSELDAMVKQGLARLADMQGSDGGWGWWKQYPSDHFMSAYVVWGLSLAKGAGMEIDPGLLTRGADFLRVKLVEQERNHDLQAWMLHALAAYQHAQDDNARSEFENKAFDNLWSNRERLNAYTRALLALAAHYYADAERAKTLVRNLESGVIMDRTPDTSILLGAGQQSSPAVIPTAHWGNDGVYHRWSDGGVEATAFALRALLAIEPGHELIEPVTNWLVKNRRGAQWSNTRDTAIVVLALTDYLRVSGELKPDVAFDVLVNDRMVATRTVKPEDALSGPSTFAIDPQLLRDGANSVRIVRKGGAGPIYFLAHASFFSHEEPIQPAGHELFVRRDYYKLVPYATLLKGYEYDRLPMKDGDSIVSGERVEVVLTIETKNNLEYLVFEDLKPAGLEAVALQSGQPLYARQIRKAGQERRFGAGGEIDPTMVARDGSDYTGRSEWVYQELRDRHVALFFNRLPEGVWEIQYELRAETPGDFHALPVMGHAMYVPEIRANSAEIRMKVYERN